MYAKACPALGHKEHMPLMNQIMRGIWFSKYVANEIRNSLFLPPMKKALMGGIGADFCVMPLGWKNICGLGTRFCPDENISAPLKKESTPDNQIPGHASECMVEIFYIYLNDYLVQL